MNSAEESKMSDNRQARSAIITGITGQDGLYLAAHLLMKQKSSGPIYTVHGIYRKNSINLPILREL